MTVIGIALGGALGALARYLVTSAVQAWTAAGPLAGFPLGTVMVNSVGSLLLGFALGLTPGVLWSPAVAAGVTTGFLGAMTTFSTFEAETFALVSAGQISRGAAYVLANLVLGYAALAIGRAAALAIASQN